MGLGDFGRDSFACSMDRISAALRRFAAWLNVSGRGEAAVAISAGCAGAELCARRVCVSRSRSGRVAHEHVTSRTTQGRVGMCVRVI
jgi:diaminopimelate decarboxylase